MINALFGSQNSTTEWSGEFAAPTKTFVAATLDEVIPLLYSADREARNGNYVVVMLSYESAPAFDDALVTHSSSSPTPLAWAAVFAEQSKSEITFNDSYKTTEWNSQVSKSTYDSNIANIRELIAVGQTYQVNYTFPMISSFEGSAISYYDRLIRSLGAKYSAYLDLGKYKVLSISPELFFERKGDQIRTKPMKGTAKRGRWTEEDQALASSLANSEKDRAENVMIVDLLRNDLGKVSIPGTVNVSSLFELERFETVWQMTSTVEAQLKPGTDLVELMRALFPCRSITGAPKIRTMEIIHQLEQRPRGLYTGTIGLLRPGGDCTFNVAIRTVVIDSETGTATFGVGGGVTIDSTAEGEYEECLVKAKFLQSAPQEFALFESILLEDNDYFLLERHIERLKSSALYFGFQFCESTIACPLERIRLDHLAGHWKIKLSLTRSGEITTEAAHVGAKRDAVRVALARSPVNSSNRLLFHKTTARDFYNAELAARPDCDDVIFFNERNEVTESTIANVVARINGKLVTPPTSAGLLAGTFRNELIDKGEIEERVITVDDLRTADELFLVNSVRRWMPVSDALSERSSKNQTK